MNHYPIQPLKYLYNSSPPPHQCPLQLLHSLTWRLAQPPGWCCGCRSPACGSSCSLPESPDSSFISICRKEIQEAHPTVQSALSPPLPPSGSPQPQLLLLRFLLVHPPLVARWWTAGGAGAVVYVYLHVGGQLPRRGAWRPTCTAAPRWPAGCATGTSTGRRRGSSAATRPGGGSRRAGTT
jgi:hypothetical protein